ncbi:MAG: hypothetical protein LUD18_15105, partial [Lachnospiraceae bacterium]|nr:hypothetical protein [Lachnospiraceae bacterium]
MGKTKLSSKRGDWLCDAVLVMLITAVALFQIDKALGVTWGYADEISYWGTAAMLTGKDWSDFMSYSRYYYFIYGLLLIPVISLPFDSVLI